ncbi:MAG TPA: DNA polymerase Y family protein [Flavisolibacter sp.]|nr:DNA polymerase Y family protein [Flavisolibacter sp.]
MQKRFISLWFHHLCTDWFALKQPALVGRPFVLSELSHGRMIITAANEVAERGGVAVGMSQADASAFVPSLEVLRDRPSLKQQLLHRLAEWCVRFTPTAATDQGSGLLLDVSGCTHLWGGEEAYLDDLVKRLKARGYSARAAMADTIGAAWALARFGNSCGIIPSGQQVAAIADLPAAALRLDIDVVERLDKLGLRQVKDFMSMPRSALRRRFGQQILQRLDQATGQEDEVINGVQPAEPYTGRLPCLEPITSRTGIEIALQQLLQEICKGLEGDGQGLRAATFRGYRVDGQAVGIQVGTARPTHNVDHLFSLLSTRLDSIEPALGIELFVLEASGVEDLHPAQTSIWESVGGLQDPRLSQLLDRITNKIGALVVQRFLPEEHWWPERSIKPAASLESQPQTAWTLSRPRPVELLEQPLAIEVTAPIPDYPPMLFRDKRGLHKIVKADGPERIEQEWWIEEGAHRDYYAVEDEEGRRYWLFRSGHYDADKKHGWFLHGFFA